MPNYIIRASQQYSLVVEAASETQAMDVAAQIPLEVWNEDELFFDDDSEESPTDTPQVKASDYLRANPA